MQIIRVANAEEGGKKAFELIKRRYEQWCESFRLSNR